MVKKIYFHVLFASILGLSFIGLDAAPKMKKTAPAPIAHRSNIIEIQPNRSQSLGDIIAKNPHVVVDFGAIWCNPCQNLARELPLIADQFQSGTKKVLFVKVDADAHKPLLSKYKVTCFPTLIYFKNGKEVARSSGWEGRAKTINNIHGHFQI